MANTTATASAWSAQKWTKVGFEGTKLVLVERDKDARVWKAVNLDTNTLVDLKADAQVEILGVLDAETGKPIKSACKKILRASKGVA